MDLRSQKERALRDLATKEQARKDNAILDWGHDYTDWLVPLSGNRYFGRWQGRSELRELTLMGLDGSPIPASAAAPPLPIPPILSELDCLRPGFSLILYKLKQTKSGPTFIPQALDTPEPAAAAKYETSGLPTLKPKEEPPLDEALTRGLPTNSSSSNTGAGASSNPAGSSNKTLNPPCGLAYAVGGWSTYQKLPGGDMQITRHKTPWVHEITYEPPEKLGYGTPVTGTVDNCFTVHYNRNPAGRSTMTEVTLESKKKGLKERALRLYGNNQSDWLISLGGHLYYGALGGHIDEWHLWGGQPKAEPYYQRLDIPVVTYKRPPIQPYTSIVASGASTTSAPVISPINTSNDPEEGLSYCAKGWVTSQILPNGDLQKTEHRTTTWSHKIIYEAHKGPEYGPAVVTGMGDVFVSIPSSV